MTTCANELHELYPDNCPGCNPEGYQALINQAPQGQVQQPEPRSSRPARGRDARGTHQGSYSDRY